MVRAQTLLRPLCLAVVIALVGYRGGGAQLVPPLQWEAGTFAELPVRGVGDLATYVDQFAHPQRYAALTAARAAQVAAMFDAIHTAITAMISGGLCT